MHAAPATKTQPEIVLSPTGTGKAVSLIPKGGITISEPVSVFAQSMAMSAVLWTFLLYFGLFLFAFLWSLSDARALYAWIMGTKAINWIITAAVVTGLVFHFRRLLALWIVRNPRPQYYSPSSYGGSGAAAAPPRKVGGVYGRASNATDHEIDGALRGKTGGFEAMFEE